jgi:hypothetical protein
MTTQTLTKMSKCKCQLSFNWHLKLLEIYMNLKLLEMYMKLIYTWGLNETYI